MRPFLFYLFNCSIGSSVTYESLGKYTLEIILEKGENAGNQHFLLFPQCFLLFHTYRKFFKVPIAANKKELVYKIKVNTIHTILKYGDYHDFMDKQWCSS